MFLSRWFSRECAKSWYLNLQVLCANLNRSQKLYLFGAVIAVLALLWWLTPFERIFLVMLVFSGLLFVSGVVSDLLYVYHKAWDTAIGKGLTLLLYALATTVAYAFAAQIVNQVVAFESSGLVRASAFVAVLLVPVFVFASTYLIFAIIFVAGQVYMLLVVNAETFTKDECLKSMLPAKLEKYPGRTLAARFFIYPATIGFLWALGGNAMPKYERFVERSAAAFVFHLEAVSNSRCVIPADAKAISVNESEVIVARSANGEYSFQPQVCVPRIAPNQ